MADAPPDERRRRLKQHEHTTGQRRRRSISLREGGRVIPTRCSGFRRGRTSPGSPRRCRRRSPPAVGHRRSAAAIACSRRGNSRQQGPARGSRAPSVARRSAASAGPASPPLGIENLLIRAAVALRQPSVDGTGRDLVPVGHRARSRLPLRRKRSWANAKPKSRMPMTTESSGHTLECSPLPNSSSIDWSAHSSGCAMSERTATREISFRPSSSVSSSLKNSGLADRCTNERPQAPLSDRCRRTGRGEPIDPRQCVPSPRGHGRSCPPRGE
jgi:hypothetical protein